MRYAQRTSSQAVSFGWLLGAIEGPDMTAMLCCAMFTYALSSMRIAV